MAVKRRGQHGVVTDDLKTLWSNQHQPHQEDEPPMREMVRLKCHSPTVRLPQTRPLWRSPPGRAEPGLAVFFSVPQHQNSLPARALTRTDRRGRLWDTGCEHTHYLLRVVTDWVNAAIKGLVYKVSIQNGGRRAERVLRQSEERGQRCNSLLSRWDQRESSTSSLCPLRARRNWGTLSFYIYPRFLLTAYSPAFRLCFPHCPIFSALYLIQKSIATIFYIFFSTFTDIHTSVVSYKAAVITRCLRFFWWNSCSRTLIAITFTSWSYYQQFSHLNRSHHLRAPWLTSVLARRVFSFLQ